MTDQQLRRRVFAMCAEMPFDDLDDPWPHRNTRAQDLANRLVQWAGDQWAGEDDDLRVLAGCTAEQMIPYCQEWLDQQIP
jgi:hypothetical protein